MSISHVRRGPVPGEWIPLRTTVTPELDHALRDLVVVTGVSKASLVRAALAHYLAARGVLPPDHPDLIEPTPTRGPGLASQRKESA